MSELKSSFGKNLVLQLVLGIVLSIVAVAAPEPLGTMFQTAAQFVFWSFSVGIVYGFFRLFEVRVDFIEWYYQNVPAGLMRSGAGTVEEHVPAEYSGDAPSAQQQAGGTSRPEWDEIFSTNFVRYAGLLLIVSSLFAYLFKIDWNLLAKTGASVLGGAIALGGAEFSHRRGKEGVAGALYAVSFALFQFAVTLLGAYLTVGATPAELADAAGNLLLVKAVLSVLAASGLTRYRAPFLPVVFFLVAYFTPLSLLRISSELPLGPGLGFALLMCLCALTYAVLRKEWRIAVLDALAANLLVIWLFLQTNASSAVLPRAGSLAGIYLTSRGGTAAFLTLISLFSLHLLAGALYSAKHKQEQTGLLVGEMLLSQFLGAASVVTVQAGIPALRGYYGITLLGLSLLSFTVYMLLRSRRGEDNYTQALLNTALVVSALGMFMQTRGAWTAVVFLSFSCVVLYVSFVLGTLRTRAYAFVVLGVSLVKLYFECYALFDSIAGTTVILIIGLVLIVLSYKLETIKARLAKREG